MTELYMELHARSAFSFLEGASLPEALIARCASLDIPAVALLDRDNLSGAVRFHQAAKKAGVRALVGAEVTSKADFRYLLFRQIGEYSFRCGNCGRSLPILPSV